MVILLKHDTLSRTLQEMGLFIFMITNSLSRVTKKLSSGFPTRSNTNQAVQPQKMARCLKFLIKEVEGLYYLCSNNKGADQLADLRLKAGFLLTRLNFISARTIC